MRRSRARPLPTAIETFGQALRAARKRLGLTQTQLAKRLHVSCDGLSRWETGGITPTPLNLATVRDFALSQPHAIAGELRAILGEPVTPPAAILETAIHRAAEALDVKTRSFRVAVDQVLYAAATARLSIEEARAIIAGSG